MRSGDPFSQLIEFSEGFPDANIAYTLRDGDGTSITTANVTPTAGSVSVNLTISGTHNTLAGGVLYAFRDLSWSYAVGGKVIAGNARYRVDSFLKYGVSEDGTRHKLGLEKHELENEAIDLLSAYSLFESTVTAAALAAVTDAKIKLLIRDAIEALAGLRLLPSLQLKVARKEASGVSEFTRAPVDWEAVSVHLNEIIAAGYTAVDPSLDATLLFGNTFIVVPRIDPITGV